MNWYLEEKINDKGCRVGFPQAISSGFSKYVDFSGRARRTEYWFWALFLVVGLVAASILDGIIGVAAFNLLFTLGTFLPSLAMSVRRLHDIDRSGWWLLITFIPIIGVIILFIWALMESTAGENKYGAEPLDGYV
jgi:uncharacterized membrane protein YhaH (DUF805 family)